MSEIWRYAGTLLMFFVLMVDSFSENGFIQDSEYHRMPKLSEIDDYDRCMEDKLPGEVSAFCMARVVIRPDNASDLWSLIEDVSKNFKIHENHAILERGICMKQCKQLVRSLPTATKEALRVPKFPINFGYLLNRTVLKKMEVHRQLYEESVHICANYKLNASYGLMGYTEIESCETSDETLEVDLLDLFCLLLIMILVMMVVLSSCYDKSMNKQKNVEHYKNDLYSRKDKLMVAFSILRNWYRLTYRSKTKKSGELRFFQGFRFFTLFGVMWGHVYSTYFYLAIQNGLEVEKESHNLFAMVEWEGTRIVQTFFIFSAFLLAVTVLESEEKLTKSSGIHVVLKGIFYRYVRLTPAYALMILITATWYPKLQNGPWWKVRANIDRSLCRENWWMNLLYINNYSSALCMDQSWYLGCEFQLFILGMSLLVAIVRFKDHRNTILSLALAVSLVWPAFTIYFGNRDGSYLDAVQYRRFFYAFDDTLTETYESPQVNLGNYLIGMITGMIYLNLRTKNIDFSQKTWPSFAWFLLVPICIGTMLLCAIFYWNDFPKPSIWIAIFFPLSKASWGVLHSVGFLSLIFGAVPVMTRILSHRIFESLGRLTYSAYLCHMVVLRIILHSSRTPIYVSTINMLSHTISTAVFSYLMALAVYLILEQPIVAILYVIFEKKKEPITTKDSKIVNEKNLDTTNDLKTVVTEIKMPKDCNSNLLKTQQYSN
ncbi:nose resistant to fluoxetine protein 6-like [Armigeres subalbatus]|uniref:nose resistant to fluoxetine protein 6-like n=1 Tax=Armigeres subalbatus TaxID=124917 RepID=UPI002ED2A1AD